MIIAAVLEKRQHQWAELEQLCDALEVRGRAKKGDAEAVARFASLYRAACADLALADAYQLPPATVTYLHRLVARAHNNLYRAERLDPGSWAQTIFQTAPRQIFSDPCVRIAALLFFGLFSLAMVIAYQETAFPQFAQSVLGERQLESLEEMYAKPLEGSLDHSIFMSGIYIWNNTGIGLQCFAFGILIVPCLFILASNAVGLGASFGYMARPDTAGGENFLHFVTAHGPFELTAIVLAAAAGLRLGVGLFSTGGLSRIDSLYRAALAAVPIMVASAVLFLLAAMTEGFISPSPLPYVFKAMWAIMSSGLLSFYFVILGFPQDLAAGRQRDREGSHYDPLGDDDERTEVSGAA
jgi:uncharacterized membrane protein SpoIIM required for sporulation